MKKAQMIFCAFLNHFSILCDDSRCVSRLYLAKWFIKLLVSLYLYLNMLIIETL